MNWRIGTWRRNRASAKLSRKRRQSAASASVEFDRNSLARSEAPSAGRYLIGPVLRRTPPPPNPPPSRGRAQLEAHILADRVEQAVDEADLALVVEGLGDVDIFRDDAAHRHVDAGEQLVGAGAQYLAHRLVEPLERPVLGQLAGDQRVEL